MEIKKTIGTIAIVGAVALGAPVIPTPMEWVVSYETVAFDTRDGDLGMKEYAIIRDGVWFIRENTKHRSNFVATTSAEAIQGKKLVSIECTRCKSYTHFRNKKGEIIRYAEDIDEYRSLKTIRGAKQPTRKEFVSILRGEELLGAIEFDATSNTGTVANASSLSWSHTVSGTNRFLYVGFTLEQDSYNSETTTVTYDSVSLTRQRGDTNGEVDIRSEAWYLVAPNTGSNTVFIDTNDEFGFFEGMGGAVSFTGVAQDTPIDAHNGATGNSTTPTVSVTTVADNTWVVDTAIHYDSSGFSVGSGQTRRWVDEAPAVVQGGSTKGANSPAGSVSMSWTADWDNPWAISAISFKPATGGGDPPTSAPITSDVIFFE